MGKKNIVQVNMWGSTVGYLHQEENGMVGFQYEGFVLGVGANMFKIAGPVIVYGTMASVVYGIIYWITTLF